MGMSPCADLITAFCDQQRMRGRSPRTIAHRRFVLGKADRELPNGLTATKEEIAGWLYRDDLSANAKASYYSTLTVFYTHFAGKRGGLACNPMADLPRPPWKTGRPRPVSHDQLARILTEAAEPYRLWTLLAAGLGARCIEISRLDRDDVTPDVTYLHGKGDKHRVVPTHPAVYAAVSVLPPGPVARTRAGDQASAHYISGMASAYFGHTMGMPGVALHRMRHWTGTYADTADLQVVQQLLGHAKPETTANTYRARSLTAMRAAVEGLPLPLSGVADAPAATRRRAAAPR